MSPPALTTRKVPRTPIPIANYNTFILVCDSVIVGDYTRTRGSSILADPISPSRLPRPPYFKTTLLILIPVACITLRIVRTFSPEGLRETHTGAFWRTYSRSEPCIPDSPQSFVAAQLIPPSFPSTFSPPPSSFISILLSPLISLPSTDRVRRARYCRLLVPPPLHDSPGYYLVLYALQPHPVSGCVDARRWAIPRENANVGAAGISAARCAAHSGFIARRKRRCSPGLFPNLFADEEK
ncbi:hypothetical protein B0H13DRAFT_2466688 [Mycena leptocephala]|nr:hypothetical protein B0H13DRAFT_2466688 [Mycena leptocephala]